MRKAWLVLPLLVLIGWKLPVQAQNEENVVVVPAHVVNSISTLNSFFPAGEWEYSFAPREVGGIDVYAIAADSAITWTYYPTLEYDIEDLDEIVDDDWISVIVGNYDDPKTIDRCIIDDMYLFNDIVGFSEKEDYTIHYWLWIDDTGWNELFAAITFDDQIPLFDFEETYFGITGACEEEE